MVYKRFSRKQLLTLLWWKQAELNKYDGLICDGSVRSGKTVAMSVGFLLWAMSTFDGCKFALCGKTIEALRRNVVSLIPGLMDLLSVWWSRREQLHPDPRHDAGGRAFR